MMRWLEQVLGRAMLAWWRWQWRAWLR